MSRAPAHLTATLALAEVRRVQVQMSCAHASKAASRLLAVMPWSVGPVTFAAVIVPVMVPDVAAGQAG